MNKFTKYGVMICIVMLTITTGFWNALVNTFLISVIVGSIFSLIDMYNKKDR